MLTKAMLAFVVGIASVTLFPQLPPLPLMAILAMAGLVLSVAGHWLGWLCLGGAWCAWFATAALDAQWPMARSGEVQLITGEVVGLPQWSDQTLRFRFKASTEGVPDLIEIRWYRPKVHLQPGEHWQLPLALYAPAGRLHFSGFDYQRHLLVEGVGATATVRLGESYPSAQWIKDSPSLMSRVHRLRQRLAEEIGASTTRLEVAALKRALLIGDRGGLDAPMRERLQATGTAHLLAISGLHVGMVAGLGGGVGWIIWFLGAGVGLCRHRARWAIGVGLLVALGYAALAGFSLPTQRALIMLGVGGLAVMSRRHIQPMHAWLVALVLVLLIQPLSILSVGLWLSFGAVGFLIWGFAWRNKRARSSVLGSTLARAQWIVMVGLLPLSALFFGQWAPAAFIANMVAIPWVGFLVLPALLTSMLLDTLNGSVSVISALGDHGLWALVWFLEWLHAQFAKSASLATTTHLWNAMALVGAVWLLGPRGMPARGLGIVLMGLIFIAPERATPANALTLTVLDVGSGLALVVEHDDYRLMFDVGPGDGLGKDAIGSLITDEHSLGKPHRERWLMDDLVLSWGHQEHAGGLGSIKALTWAKRIYYAPSVNESLKGISGATVSCQRGHTWQVGPWRFEFLHPGPWLPDLGGNSSCVLRISSEHTAVLLTSGLDAAGEAHLLHHHRALQADVWVVARAGHRSTASEAFLAQIQPSIAIISAGQHDRYQRPAEEVMERLSRMNVSVLETSQCGSLRLSIMPNGAAPTITKALDQRRRFWHRQRNCSSVL